MCIILFDKANKKKYHVRFTWTNKSWEREKNIYIHRERIYLWTQTYVAFRLHIFKHKSKTSLTQGVRSQASIKKYIITPALFSIKIDLLNQNELEWATLHNYIFSFGWNVCKNYSGEARAASISAIIIFSGLINQPAKENNNQFWGLLVSKWEWPGKMEKQRLFLISPERKKYAHSSPGLLNGCGAWQKVEKTTETFYLHFFFFNSSNIRVASASGI